MAGPTVGMTLERVIAPRMEMLGMRLAISIEMIIISKA